MEHNIFIRGRASLLALIAGLFFSYGLFAQTIWVGETYMCDATSAVMGLTSDVSWSSSGGYISLSGSGLYRNVTATQYWSGMATVTCSWKYRLYSGDTWKTRSKSWTFICKENPVSISPTNMTLSPGETAYVSYSHKYSNSYTYFANARFSSSNSRVATVSNSGLVTAVSEGTAYINVYSKISSAMNAPYCTVVVKKTTPTGVSLPSPLSLIVGESKTLIPTVSPSGASTSFTWLSDDSSVASVNSAGSVIGVKAGNTKIRVMTVVGDCTDSCNVMVKNPPVAPSEVTIRSSLNMYVGFSCTLVPILSPDNAETTCAWTSDNTSVAEVNASGKVTAKKEGAAIIMVTTQNGLKAICAVSVKDLPSNISESRMNSKMAVVEILINKTFRKAY